MTKTISNQLSSDISPQVNSFSYWQKALQKYLDPPNKWNPTVGLFIGGYALAGMTIWQWNQGNWPLPLLVGLAFLALHMEGTVIHDACHNAAHPNKWINQAMGHGSAILLGFSFPVFTRVHLQHHSHVNDPKNDPDHIVSTFGPVWLIAPRFFYHEYFFFKRQLWRRYELMQWGLERGLFITIILAGIQYNFMNIIYNLWFGPALMVGVTLGIFFDYLPHRPFIAKSRWKNARVYPSRTMNLIIMGQNYHLVHHLWPSIPWFEYQPAYYATKKLLDLKGSPQRMGIFETRSDILNFIYDVFIGIRSHKKRRSKMRRLATLLPTLHLRRQWISLLNRTAVAPKYGRN